jgi:hypothetical protein
MLQRELMELAVREVRMSFAEASEEHALGELGELERLLGAL